MFTKKKYWIGTGIFYAEVRKRSEYNELHFKRRSGEAKKRRSGEAYLMPICQVMRTWRTSGTSISITPQTWPGLYHIWIIIASCLVLEAALSLVKCAGRWASAAAREPAGEHNEDDTHTPDTTVRNVLGGTEPNYLEVKSSGSSPWPNQIFFFYL